MVILGLVLRNGDGGDFAGVRTLFLARSNSAVGGGASSSTLTGIGNNCDLLRLIMLIGVSKRYKILEFVLWSLI